MDKGLTSEEVKQRIEKGEVNGSQKRMTRSVKEIVRSNIVTYFNIINTILFIIVLCTGEIANATFYITIVFNAIIGIVQELKSKQLLDRMAIMVATKTEVKRDGTWTEIPVEDIVLDDLIRIEKGTQIPVDATLTEGYLEVDESMLTGESNTVVKGAGDPLYAGTIVTAGQADAKTIHVGKNCVSSKIMADAQKEKHARSLLHDELNRMIGIISIIIIPAGIILFITHYHFIGLGWKDSALKTVAAVVGMIPEGLVVLTSIALAVSTVRLSVKNVLVQDLFSIESLARVDTICLDKTGTLTKGTMEVTDVIPLLGSDPEQIRDIMGSYLRSNEKPNMTSQAMLDYFHTNEKFRKTDELPFSSERKYAGASLEGHGSFYVGAANFLFPHGAPAVNKRIGAYTEAGERVIVLAHTKETSCSKDHLPDDLEPMAMICIRDVLRDNVQNIMQYFTSQDVNIRVISGDDPATVSSLAAQAGVPHAENYLNMAAFDGDYEKAVRNYTVFGRVLPDQKKNLVKALQKEGHTVAMTGDGVNDVPALKSADVSVAMAAGSSAAKDSANIVLLTNDFGQMPSIVDEGRRVINNISRASSMYLVKTTFSILLSLYVIILRQQYPFLPIHLSIISAFGVGLPTFLLQLEPSFERVKGKFFSRAFRNAVPSAIAVFLTAMICILIRNWLHLPLMEFYGIFVALTAYIYLYTLYRVYYPPTVLRYTVMISMAVILAGILIFFGDIANVSYQWKDLLILIPGVVILPFLISYIAKGYNWLSEKIGRLNQKVYQVFHHGKDRSGTAHRQK